MSTHPNEQILQDHTTSFGYEEVGEQKKSRVAGVFSSVASRYDIMNDVMSMGVHRLWKQAMVSHLRPFEGARLLDIAGGTGDISARFIDRAVEMGVSDIHATISDINPDMLEEGRKRAFNRNRHISRLSWQQADAEDLPFDDSTFDYVTIAFGIRNVTHIDKALQEARRVLKKGGMFACLEFSHVEEPILKRVYDIYSDMVIPKMGRVIAGDRASYEYLVQSIRKFPQREVFSSMMREAGFVEVSVTAMSQGIVALHRGFRV